QLSYYGRRDHLHHLHARENEAAALYVTSLSSDCALARSQVDRGTLGTLLKKLRARIGLNLSCYCSCRSAIRSPLLSRVRALPGISRSLTARHGIWRGRLQRAKPGLVFPRPGARVSHAVKQRPDGRFHGESGTTLCD